MIHQSNSIAKPVKPLHPQTFRKMHVKRELGHPAPVEKPLPHRHVPVDFYIDAIRVKYPFSHMFHIGGIFEVDAGVVKHDGLVSLAC